MPDSLTGDKLIYKPFGWKVSAPILLPGPRGTFDEVAVKDPSVVFFEGQWHVFYTARSTGEYTTGYVSAETLEGLQSAPRHELKMIRGKRRYGCAPQIFYFTPQRTWYLIFQTYNANYQPTFSTTRTLSKPETWSQSQPLIVKDTSEKWIDFWVICDWEKAYLFYTQAHHGVMVRSTKLNRFPGGWGEARMVFDGVHEAVHIYKVQGKDEFHMIYELNMDGVRSFGLAHAGALAGPWIKASDTYATGDQLENDNKTIAWTDMVSHGEVIRADYNEQMEYETRGCRWLIQGMLNKGAKVPYPSLPWKLGIMAKINLERRSL